MSNFGVADLFSRPLAEQLAAGQGQDQDQGGLDEEAEVHLLEALSLLTSSANSDRDRGPNPSPNPSQQQLFQSALLQQLLQTLSSQIHSLSSLVGCLPDHVPPSKEIGAGSEAEAEVPPAVGMLARRIHGAASLCCGFTHRTHSSASPHFEGAFTAVLSSLLAPTGPQWQSPLRYGPVRASTVVLTHKALLAVGPRCLQLQLQVQGQTLLLLAALLRTLLGQRDLDYVPQLLNQIMVEFRQAAVDLVADLLPAVFDRLSQAGLEQGRSAQGGEEAPHMAAERASPRRQLLLLLQHVSTHDCQAAFFCSPMHERYLEATLEMTMSCLQGRILNSSSSLPSQASVPAGDSALILPLQRAALVILTALSKAWLPPAAEGGMAPPLQLREAFRSFLFSSALPALLLALSDPRNINARDANAQGVLAEAASLLWTVVSSYQAGEAELAVVQTAGAVWPAEACNRLAQLLGGARSAPLGTFRESFKQMIRSLSGVK